MKRYQKATEILASGVLAAFGAATCFAGPKQAPSMAIKPKTMVRVGSVDERYQSYNIEMVEVTGGRFWKPYASKGETQQPGENQPSGMSASLFEYRKPIDLYNPRLRMLAAALGPAYVRVSGTWANTTFFFDSDALAPEDPPAGFKGVLTRPEWKGVVDFSKAVDAKLMTSAAISPGVRDASGVWTPVQEEQLLTYTKSVGGSIAAMEFMNEPNMPDVGGAPKGYDAAEFGRDLSIFRTFIQKTSPSTLIVGPGGVNEESNALPAGVREMKSADILSATGPAFDVFSYHFYGAVSSRCASFGESATTSAAAALSAQWLARAGKSEQFYAGLRDRFEPGKQIWLTETAQAACGGDRWASTFLDSFRYLNQLGSLARNGVRVQMYNTLAASDYGLLDEKTYEPRPNYWAALLWHRLMGTTVLDPGPSPAPNLHLYAQCLRNHPGGVALLVINADRTEAYSLRIPVASERFTLTAHELTDKQVQLNGGNLQLGADDRLPELKGASTVAGNLSFAPASITFLALPAARNAGCQP